MGYMMVYGYCIACKRPIQFNPIHVPSLRVNGVREPLCGGCANRWNQLHPENARPIHPQAYEPASEEEV